MLSNLSLMDMDINMNAAYAQAIEILMQDNVDFRSIVVSLAKQHPEILVEIAGRKVSAPQWHRDVVACALSPNRVAAVKLYREHTGAGLKEALDVINHLQNLLFRSGHAVKGVDCAQPGLVTIAEAEKIFHSVY